VAALIVYLIYIMRRNIKKEEGERKIIVTEMISN
jgi:hypothetical protein